jgi:hypothetical protein
VPFYQKGDSRRGGRLFEFQAVSFIGGSIGIGGCEQPFQDFDLLLQRHSSAVFLS